MRGVFSLILISSFILTSCSLQGSSPKLRSLSNIDYYHIVQTRTIDSTAVPGADDQYPYYVLCASTDDSCFQAMDASSHLTSVRRQPVLSPGGNVSTIASAFNHHHASTVLVPFIVHFDYARSNITTEFHKRLNDFSSQYAGTKSIRITGYTDNQRLSDGQISNIALALDRASSVSRYLVARGFPRHMISLEAKELCCYIGTNENEEGRRKNRRAEINFL